MMQHVAPVHIHSTHYTRLWRNDYWAIFDYWHLYLRNDL